MAESDGDIEYLDEDADIVQQCVQVVQPLQPVVQAQTMPDVNVTDNKPPLLVERVPAERKLRKRKKRKEEEDDSDYDPSDDALPPSPPSPPSPRTKKKKTPNKKVKTYIRESVPTMVPILNIEKRKVKEVPLKEFKLPVLDRKKCSIRIPDYDDPLCLPVKAIKQEESDIKRLKNWNNVCLEHFRNCDTLLKPEKGNTHRSMRSVVFRNVPNKQTGRMETTLWSKTCVENENGDRKSELFQCVLPRYKEKKILNMYAAPTKRPRTFHISDEVILCKEEIKDTGDVLVVYKPKEATSSVFKLARDECKNTDSQEKMEEEDVKMHLKEITHCRMCAQCFQVSWRGMKKAHNKNINCPICSRSTVNVYNLLAHFKTHSSDEIKKYKKIISAIMAQIVEYHYKCRLCREQCGSIKQLRQHITTHRTNETFKCEIGNHMTR